jgi:hypothetical protein
MCTPTPGGDCSSTGGKPTVLQIGGTSASAPAFAGVVAILNQATGGRLGNINPMLYALASSAPSSFHDITSGNNEVACTTGTDPGCASSGLYGFAATTGYDCATGLGSIDATNLVTAWAQAQPTTTTLTPSATSTTEGADVTLTAMVTASQPGTAPIAGTVTFAFQSYLANGEPDLSWNVGEATITGGSVSTGTASVTAKLPPGMVNPAAQYVDVVAMYGGESAHLASRSTLARITIAPPAFCIVPGVKNVAPGASFVFGSASGVGNVRWYSSGDTTCDTNGNNCSTLDTTTGLFTAGTGQPGWVLVVGIDGAGAETFSEITVGNPTTGTPPWDGDSGVLMNPCDPSVDASFAEVGPDAADAADAADTFDSGALDTGVVDTGAPDTTVVDTGVADTSAPDTATATDTDVADTSVADASVPADQGVSDATPVPESVSGSGCSCETGARDRSTFAPSLGIAALALVFARRRSRR